MLSTQARSAFVSIDEGRAGLHGSLLGIRLCFVRATTCLSAAQRAQSPICTSNEKRQKLYARVK
ncbi:hypothetical protein CG401_05660 [Bifidobacteriaceae bacterium NR019]|nr:hypothetical protein CG401_05660 [Bifidobacteriaceae bacterium NR019]